MDIIESYLVYEPTTPVNNTFVFQAPIQPLQSGEVNTVGVNEDISGGYWSVSTLSRSLKVYSDLFGPFVPDYRVTGHRGVYTDLIRDWLRDIKDDIDCLSYESSSYINSPRSPWSDHFVYAIQGPALLENVFNLENVSPYAWISEQLIADQVEEL